MNGQKWEARADFTILGWGGAPSTVRGYVRKPWGVNQQYLMRGRCRSWVLTHLPTGRRVAIRCTLSECKRLAAALEALQVRWSSRSARYYRTPQVRHAVSSVLGRKEPSS